MEQSKEWLDEEWFESIVDQRDRFKIILKYLQDCINQSDSDDIYFSIIAAKVDNPRCSTSELAEIVNTSQPHISHALGKYKATVFGLLNAYAKKKALRAVNSNSLQKKGA